MKVEYSHKLQDEFDYDSKEGEYRQFQEEDANFFHDEECVVRSRRLFFYDTKADRHKIKANEASRSSSGEVEEREKKVQARNSNIYRLSR
jgi:hypothetical protein